LGLIVLELLTLAAEAAIAIRRFDKSGTRSVDFGLKRASIAAFKKSNAVAE
jgi:hypothetical protein